MDALLSSFQHDRRFSKRHDSKAALRVRVWKSNIPEQRAECINLSERGVFFATNSPFLKGEAIQVLLKMPEEISGVAPTEWRCTGFVVRVEPVGSRKGKLGVGVRFECYEILRPSLVAEIESEVLHAGLKSPKLGLPSQKVNAHAKTRSHR